MNTHQTEIFHRLIAIVSQNQTLANILKEQCLLYGFQHVRTTPDWPGILQFLPHHLPDIIVSDQLPTFDAQQLQKIRDAQKRCYTVLPVVLYALPHEASQAAVPDGIRIVAALYGRDEQQRLLEVIHHELDKIAIESHRLLEDAHFKILIASTDKQLSVKIQQRITQECSCIQVLEEANAVMACIQEQRPQLVFLDDTLTHIQNLSLLYWIKDTSPGSAVIMMGKGMNPDLLAELRKIGVYNYLQKPFDVDVLSLLCRRVQQKFFASDARGEKTALWTEEETRSQAISELQLLKESEENFRTLIDASGDIVFRITPQGVLNFASPAVEEQLGYTREDLEEQRINVSKFVHPQDLIRVMAGIRKVIGGTSIKGLECRLMHQDKIRFRWYSINCYPMYNSRQQFVGVGGIARDIGSIKEFEKKIRRQNERLSALNTIARIVGQSLNLDDILHQVIDSVLEIMHLDAGGVYVLEPENNEFFLKSCRTSESKNESIEHNILDLLDILEELGTQQGFDAKAPVIIENIVDHPQYSQTALVDLEFRTLWSIPLKAKDVALGIMILFSKSLRQLSEDDLQLLLSLGNQIGMTIENIMLYEQELKARKRLEELNKLKDDFVAIVSHDLRSPLSAILGATEILLNDEFLDTPLTDEQHELVTDIQNMGAQQLQLVNDLLDVAKIESGKLELKPTLADMPTVIRQCYQTLRVLANNKNIELSVNAVPHLPRLRIDVPKISQVINNLVGNAIKFTNPGGKVTIRLEKAEEHTLKISVEDTGEGIQPEHLSLLFNKYQQIKTQGTRGERGSGLGLAICKNLVELHNGAIWAESRVGIGSTFTFTLPVTEAVIVIIDDSLFVVKSLESILTKHVPHVKVRYALNGDDGMNLIEEANPVVVILDYMMPEMDGITVFRELRKRLGNKVPPTIFLTASQDLDVRRQIFELGAADYLQKPVDVNDFLPRLSRFL